MAETARSEFILGGQRSGKSRRAEDAGRHWLAADPGHSAVMLATAQAWDAEMRERIARHKTDRVQRVPGMRTVEESRHVPAILGQLSAPKVLVVVDCLTLWLTHLTLPLDPADALDEAGVTVATDALCQAIAQAAGPVVLVGNEIGLGVIPMGRDVRQFVDGLGRLNQRVAAVCERVTFMAAGLPLTLKGGA
ncbi:MAG: bifunctional adenosylcobinamide kinase/adenosylcobinamide-phosphate guanylyltransferase [Burkholderiales bacterium]|jgi:adenosylcobinamide kinase/adenosylcobinamide-phosphate guanylyltransferase|nr:bifunctional adenosylcobinamide kinase/adenosylcobinamide-phosphate guanylyltransferase [Burkholderiales bacterium]